MVLFELLLAPVPVPLKVSISTLHINMFLVTKACASKAINVTSLEQSGLYSVCMNKVSMSKYVNLCSNHLTTWAVFSWYEQVSFGKCFNLCSNH